MEGGSEEEGMGFIKSPGAAHWAAAGASSWTGEALSCGAEDSRTGEPSAETGLRPA